MHTDKLNAAHHEAGHLILAIAFGLDGGAMILPTNTTDPAVREWCGNCKFGPITKLSKRQLAAISIAGEIAELRLSGDSADAEDVVAYIHMDNGYFTFGPHTNRHISRVPTYYK